MSKTEKQIIRDHLPPIGKWKQTPENSYVITDGKIMLADFIRVCEDEETYALREFKIHKTSYENQLEQICRYINYFEDIHDKDKELMYAYLKLKYDIDNRKSFRIENPDSKKSIINTLNIFIPYVHEILFKETNIPKLISDFVEENYLDDIDSTNPKSVNKEYLESLEFTNDHIKLMLKISMGIKILSPIMFHYFYVNRVKPTKDTDYIYRFYRRFFDDIFDMDGINIFNKIFVYVKSRVKDSFNTNTLIVDKREIFGDDEASVISSFVKRIMISENLVKFSFPEVWDVKLNKYKENPKGFIKTVLKYQLMYYMKEVYEKNLTEVSSAKNTDGLSGADKMEMNISKMDEGKGLLAQLNADLTTEYIKKMIDINIDEDEFIYLKRYYKPTDLQISLICAYYAGYYGNIRDTALVTADNFIYLALLLKKKLLIEAGWEEGDDKPIINCFLPYVLTGKFEGRSNNRIMSSDKYLNKLVNDPYYRNLANGEYSLLLEIDPDRIKDIVKEIATTNFSYITPENKELLGTPILYTEDQIGSEIIQLLNQAIAI